MNMIQYIRGQQEWVSAFLMDLIRIESISGNEGRVVQFLYDRLKNYADEITLCPLDDSLLLDKEYSDVVKGNTFQGRYNLRLVKRGRGKGKIFFNSHMDVVPPSTGHVRPFEPELRDGSIYGRGACDAKGQLASMALLLKAVCQEEALDQDIIFHMVVEEETGGNGTLAMLRQEQEEADFAIVMEPSDLDIVSTCRGAVWFRLTIQGEAAHAGSAKKVENVTYKAMRAVELLRAYHEKLLAESKDWGLYKGEPNPMSMTVGKFQSGNWPSMLPDRAEVAGVQGFLPNVDREQVMAGMRSTLENGFGSLEKQNIVLEFNYRHDASEIEPDHPIVRGFLNAGAEAGIQMRNKAFTASCDAVYYRKLKKIPVVIFGPGSLSLAHTGEERICAQDLVRGAEVLARFLKTYKNQNPA